MEGNQLSDTDNSSSIKASKWHPSSNFWLIISLIVMVLSLSWFVHSIHQPQEKPIKPISVVTAVSTSKDVPVFLPALGTVRTKSTVRVKTQINGVLLEVPFKEGQMVKKGDLLAQIDPRPYEALLTQYEGNLKRDMALLANAKIDLKRYQTLWRQDSVSQQTLATQKSLVEQYEGLVKIDEGLIQSTKVNLVYCRITSPIDGRIGLRLVDAGNFVQVADTEGIAVINKLNPIRVVFTVPEDFIPEIIPQVYANKTLVVQAYDRQQNKLLAQGKLLTIDNQIDPATGTVKLKASFENKNNVLFPNQFVNIKLLVKTLIHATLVPTAAIQHAAGYDFIYLLRKDHTVSVQKVITGLVDGNDTVIIKGISPGEVVVVEGTDKLTDGAEVIDQNQIQSSRSLKTASMNYSLRSLS